eukprot:m.1105455 g.1105455  ORF g.1105455 m.1105455 type:complete len:802 (-) comp24339_c0_seq4:3596-6001(-)
MDANASGRLSSRRIRVLESPDRFRLRKQRLSNPTLAYNLLSNPSVNHDEFDFSSDESGETAIDGWVPASDVDQPSISSTPTTPEYSESNSYNLQDISSQYSDPDEVTKIHRSKSWSIFLWLCSLFATQFRVLVPVSVCLILFQVFVLKSSQTNIGPVVGGLFAAMIGLSFFMLGLEIGIMPLGESMGRALPRKVSMPTMLFLVFVLGCGCTFAEPAVSALQLAGQLIDPVESPYLWLLLVDPGYNMALVLCIAFGVGLAALVGTLRTIRGWNLPVLITVSVLLTLGLTVALQMSPAAEVAGMAWDSGAVTTGCVTVPLVLALGVGILSSARPDGTDARGADPSPLDGFGVVTLASIFPVALVLCLALLVGHTISVDDILTRQTDANGTVSRSPSLSVNATSLNTDADAEELDPSLENEVGILDETPWLELYLAVRAISPLVGFLLIVFRCILNENFPRVSIGPEPYQWKNQSPFYGVGVCFVGLFLFNVGLSYGLSALGNEVGEALPGLFMELPGDSDTPLMSRDGGLALSGLFAWLLGLGATLAEPALNQLGITTEKLTRRRFRRVLVVGSVASGVSIGVMLGTLKLILDLRNALFYMLYGGYFLALLLTTGSRFEYVCVAWDSAGVTTGAITVPLVLAIGLGIGDAVQAKDAFGLLAMASVAPIISVLLTGLVLSCCCKRESKMPYKIVGKSDTEPVVASPASTGHTPHRSENVADTDKQDVTTDVSVEDGFIPMSARVATTSGKDRTSGTSMAYGKYKEKYLESTAEAPENTSSAEVHDETITDPESSMPSSEAHSRA